MSNPSQVVAPVVLGPGMSAVEAVQYLREGRTDLEALRAWAMSTVVEMTKENSMALMSSGLSIPDFCEINERQKEFAKRSSKTDAGRAYDHHVMRLRNLRVLVRRRVSTGRCRDSTLVVRSVELPSE